MVRRTVFYFVLLLAFALVAACGGNANDPEPGNGQQGAGQENSGEGNGATPAPADEEITLKVLQFWPEHEQQMKASFDLFSQQNPNIKVEMTTVTWDTVYNTLQTMIASDDRPDLAFGWPGPYTTGFAEQGEVMELTAALEADADWKNSITPFALNFGTTADGKVYNLPFRGSFFTAFFNKEIFDANGISIPTTVDELVAVFETLKGKGILPIASQGSPNLPDYFITYLQTNSFKNANGDLKTYSKGETPWNDEHAVNALQQFQGWFNNGYFDPNLLTITREQAQQQFYDGKAAILMANNNELGTIRDAASFELGQFTLPFDNGEKYAFGNMDGFFVLAKTKHPEEAVKLAKFLGSEEAQSLWAKETGSAMTNPVANGAIEDPFIAATAQEIAHVNPLNEPNFYVTYSDQTWLNERIEKWQGLLLNKFTAQEVADWMQAQKEKFIIQP